MATIPQVTRVEADLGQLILGELRRLRPLGGTGADTWQVQLALLTAGVIWKPGEFGVVVDQLVVEGTLRAENGWLALTEQDSAVACSIRGHDARGAALTK